VDTMTLAPDRLVGTVLRDRYELIERIGRGGTAVVYRGVDHLLGRPVAVKIIHDTLVGDDDYTRRFDREALAAAGLSHPNIVAIFDRGMAGERPYIVMEFVRGQSLRQVVAQQAPLAPLIALGYLDAIARALAAAHEAGLMHRDVKPENVLITPNGQVKVTDFGLAKACQTQDSSTHSVLMGTLSYLAPEILTTGQATYASDVYACGIVLYELLTGQKPHTGDEAANVLYKHVHVDVPPPSQALSGATAASLPDYLDALVLACTARDASRRPLNGRVLERDIAQVRRRLHQGILADPALAARLAGLAARPETAPQTTVLLPDPPTRPGPVTPDQWAVPDVSAPEPGGLADPEAPALASAPAPAPARASEPVAPVRPLVQLSREPKYVRRRIGLIVLASLLVLALAGAGVTWWWFQTGRWTTQPAVAGAAAGDAQTLLANAGFAVSRSEAYSEDVAAGLVIESQPGDGARIVKHGDVALVVSKGPERYTMPDLRTMTQDQAVAALQNCPAPADERAAKCPKLGQVTQTWDDTVPAGVIMAQSQDANAALPPGTAVDVTVSQGPEPITITDHAGQSAVEAKAALEAQKFVVTVTDDHSATVPVDAVISQQPNSGTGHHGDTITLVKSLGPVMVTVPNVVGKSQEDAKALLTQAGLVATVQPLDGHVILNLVRSQSVPEGKTLPQGSSVTIIVA